jgi:AcrR family transcriptional regulator
MSRPVTIQDAAVLAAAAQVFLEHGYQASTAVIARRAGISEGSLFKRFHTKTELFLAAMDVQSREPEWQDRLLAGVGRVAMATALAAYGQHLLERLQTVMPRILMVTSSGLRFAENYHPTPCPLPLQHVALLTQYLLAEQRAGGLHLTHPAIQADIFVGAISHCVFCETLFGRRTISHADYIRTLVENILRAGQTAVPPSRVPPTPRRRTVPRKSATTQGATQS